MTAVSRYFGAGSELTQPFWDGCTDGRLLVQECSRCATRWFTPEAVCVECLSPDWSWAESPGTGEVYSVTVVHRAPSDAFVGPYAIGVVELDDGWSFLANLNGQAPEGWQVGDRVVVTFSSFDGRAVPSFRKAH